MTSEPSQTAASHQESPALDVGHLIQQRALRELERANAKPYRSPRRIVLTVLAVVITMFLFLTLMDAGVKVTHRIIDIWAPVIFDAKKPAVESPQPTTDPSTPYMISVVPSASQHSSASGQRAQ